MNRRYEIKSTRFEVNVFMSKLNMQDLKSRTKEFAVDRWRFCAKLQILASMMLDLGSSLGARVMLVRAIVLFKGQSQL